MSQFIDQFFLSFGLFSIFALIGGLLSARFRQPTVIGLLAVGAIIGPNVLGIISDNEAIEVLAEFGAALLLFSIGLQFSISKLIGSSVKAVMAASAIMLLLFVVGYEAGLLLGLTYIEAILLGACFSFSSTAIFVRQLTYHKLVDSSQVPLLISILIVEDIVAVTVLTVVSSIKHQSLGALPSLSSFLLPIFFSLVVMGFVYLIILGVLDRLLRRFVAHLTDEYVILLSLGLTLLLAFLSAAIGLSPAIGAFVSGSILAGLPIKKAVEKSMSPFSYAFSSFFFLSIGLFISPLALFGIILQVSLLSIVFSASAFFIVMSVVYLLGYDFRQALMAGASFAVISEFSLLIAKEASGIVLAFDLISTLAAIIFLTTIFSSLLLANRDKLYRFLVCCRLSKHYVFRNISRLREYVGALVSEFEGRGQYIMDARRIFLSTLNCMKGFAIIGSILILLMRFFSDLSFEILGRQVHISYFILGGVILVFLPTLIQIGRQLMLLADAIVAVFTRSSPGGERIGRRVIRNFLILIFFFIIFLLLPVFFSLLQLPTAFNALNLIPLFGMIVIGWDSVSSFLSFISSRRGLKF
ncbi:MAG: cation:proton antiporter [Candidatus Micrarchaeota archaeon]